VPAYKLIRVWQRLPEDITDDITWDQVSNYHADKVGHWEPNPEELWLYINMDEERFRLERLRWGRRFGDNTTNRLVDRYVAYIAFHLFQLFDFSREHTVVTARDTSNGEGNLGGENEPRNDGSYDPESPSVILELRRVSATLIQTLRSEAEIAQLQDAGSQTDY
jgi:hypothetical protein